MGKFKTKIEQLRYRVGSKLIKLGGYLQEKKTEIEIIKKDGTRVRMKYRYTRELPAALKIGFEGDEWTRDYVRKFDQFIGKSPSEEIPTYEAVLYKGE